MTSAVVGHKEAAEHLGISPDTLWRWRDLHKIPYFRYPNGNPKYSILDLDKWLAARRVTSREDIARLKDRRRS